MYYTSLRWAIWATVLMLLLNECSKSDATRRALNFAPAPVVGVQPVNCDQAVAGLHGAPREEAYSACVQASSEETGFNVNALGWHRS
ncbi:hypothetical protein OYE22_10925 [Streptomyces sp. 71268]|uniref:hypothetical protein n=1 Tax=Streptomyces sp. 71268 TaxID=3002640 RepID=UPI0023F897E1|nr:hypothetical protein [Streptomyces sp. 71268]WEV25652.1 hypothetical protein OYE22_10925 [Streptomyces sp. 71268]